MTKSKGDAGEYEFTRAAYDELRDAEHQFGVQFELKLEPTAQRGVWLLAVGAWKPDDKAGMAYVSKWSGSWPNSQVVTYGAFLYQACHRCVRMVEAWHYDEALHDARQDSMG